MRLIKTRSGAKAAARTPAVSTGSETTPHKPPATAPVNFTENRILSEEVVNGLRFKYKYLVGREVRRRSEYFDVLHLFMTVKFSRIITNGRMV